MAKKKTAKRVTVKQQQVLNQLKQDKAVADLLFNAATTRSTLFNNLLDPRRNINDECGYPNDIDVDDYKSLYDREGIATRVVDVMPEESWQVDPKVFEDDDLETDTKFETALKELGKSLGGKGWYQGGEGNPLWEWLRRVDKLSGIGTFGVLLLGLDDGLDLNEPAAGINEKGENVSGKEQKLLYLRAFDESLVQITAYESDKANPRYGQPTFYNVTLNDSDVAATQSSQPSTTTISVHWSRIIHVADNLGSSELFGAPRMQAVFNRLMDLRKEYGGSAEMYWKGAFPGLSIETIPQLGPDAALPKELPQLMEKYHNGLQRYLAMSGMTAKMLSPTVVDPTPQITVQIEFICITKGIPKRIFMGSERGELASSEDDDAWNDVIRDRQSSYLTPRIIIPFIDRIICLGVLPEPKGYNVSWTDLDSLTDSEQADIAVKQTEAMSKYVQGNVEQLITPLNYFVRVLGFSKEEAMKILDDTMDAEEEDQLTISPEPEPGPMGFDAEGKPLEPGIPATQLKPFEKQPVTAKKEK